MSDPRDELKELHLKFAESLFLQGRMDESSTHFSRAMVLGADRVRCLMGVGISMMSSGRHGEALPLFSSLESDGSNPTPVRCLAAINCGVCAFKAGDAPACLDAMGRALRLFSGMPSPMRFDLGGLAYIGSLYMIHFTMGSARETLQDFDGAVESFELALGDEAGGVANGLNVDLAKVELAYCRMKVGLVDARSWELHERRWWTGRVALERILDPPINFGDPRGRTVMVYSEQGYGDSIQFSRFVRGLKAMGAARVVLVTHRPLAKLLSRVEGVDEVAASGDPHSPYEMHLPIMSLPHAIGLGGGLEAYSAPYIGVDPADAASWGARIPGGFRVGLVWAGSPKLEQSKEIQEELRLRNIPLRTIMEGLQTASSAREVRFVSLQQEDREGELSAFPSVFDPMGGVSDYYDTACVIANLDLVVAVDTSVAHLAGAMGKPVFMLSRYKGCWRWGSEGRCLAKRWYPSMAIYREAEHDNWAPAVEAAARDFGVLLEGMRA
jgi:hypothetical protein